MRRGRPKERYGWIDAAGCRGVGLDVFFPLGQGASAGPDEDRAKQICATCPVLGPCREWSLRVAPEFGIFGGLTPGERRSLRRTRAPRTATPRR